MIYENVELTGSLDISGSFQVPFGVSGSEPTSPSSGSLFFNTTNERLYVWEGSWEIVGTQVPPPASADIEYLVVAGGGAGGGTAGINGNGGGGGGAGGLLSASLSSIESGSSITVTVGAAGAGSTYGAGEGSNSSIASTAGTSFTTVTSTGGGGGGQEFDGAAGSYTKTVAGEPGDGGSGGGGCTNAGNNSIESAGSGTTGQGNDGGISTYGTLGYNSSGGGGGAGAAGQDGPGGGYNNTHGGDGGDGKQSSITGTSTYYAGGGGGGGYYTSPASSGGQGGGANGGAQSSTPPNGTANTGGGGGGRNNWNNDGGGGSGGSGVVILAYPSSSINAAGGIIGDAGNGRKYHQFNSSGTLKVGATSDFGIVTDSLVAHYDAGNFASRGTSTWTDLQGSYNGSVSGATLGGNFYYDFDGSNDGITNTSIANTSTFTVEIWIKFNTIGSGQLEFIDFANNGGSSVRINTYNSSQIRFANRSNQTYINSITTGQWYHLALSSDGSTATPYVDTTSQTTYVEPGLSGTYTGLYIGRNNDGNRFSDCQIAQLRIYSTNLSATEVLQNYNATKTNFV